MSPSPERFDPIKGVKGKPERNVPMPFTCQPEMNLLSTRETSFSQRWLWPKGSS